MNYLPLPWDHSPSFIYKIRCFEVTSPWRVLRSIDDYVKRYLSVLCITLTVDLLSLCHDQYYDVWRRRTLRHVCLHTVVSMHYLYREIHWSSLSVSSVRIQSHNSFTLPLSLMSVFIATFIILVVSANCRQRSPGWLPVLDTCIQFLTWLVTEWDVGQCFCLLTWKYLLSRQCCSGVLCREVRQVLPHLCCRPLVDLWLFSSCYFFVFFVCFFRSRFQEVVCSCVWLSPPRMGLSLKAIAIG